MRTGDKVAAVILVIVVIIGCSFMMRGATSKKCLDWQICARPSHSPEK